MVDEILRARKICRTPRGQSLYGVYQNIYQQVRQQLLHDVDQALNNCNTQHDPVREWANTLRDNAFRKVLDDTQLQGLALAAQQSESQTEERHYALRELLEAIRLSGRLCRPHSSKIPARFYNLIYEEAVNQTLLYVWQKIDKYDPQKGKTGNLITWLNFRLDKLVIESWNDFLSHAELFSAEDIDNLPLVEKPPSLGELIREYIEEDAGDIFKHQHIKDCPDANFQSIALARISGESWKDISAKFGGIKVAALSNLFRRSCKKFAHKFGEYL